MKRVLSLVLAFVMVLGMMVPSFAAGPTAEKVTVTITGGDSGQEEATATALANAKIKVEPKTETDTIAIEKVEASVKEDDKQKVELSILPKADTAAQTFVGKEYGVSSDSILKINDKFYIIEHADWTQGTADLTLKLTELTDQTPVTAQLQKADGSNFTGLTEDEQKAVASKVILPKTTEDGATVVTEAKATVNADGMVTVNYKANQALADYEVMLDKNASITIGKDAYSVGTQDGTNIQLVKANPDEVEKHEFDNQKLIIALKDEAGALVLKNKGLDAVGFNKDLVKVTKANGVNADDISVNVKVDPAGYIYITAANGDELFEEGDYKVSLGAQDLKIANENYILEADNDNVISFTVNDDNEITKVNDSEDYAKFADVPVIEAEVTGMDYFIKVIGKDNELIDFSSVGEPITVTLKQWDEDEEEFVNLDSSVSFTLPINRDGNVALPIKKIKNDNKHFMIDGEKYEIGKVFLEVSVNAPDGSGYVDGDDNSYIIDLYKGAHISRVSADKISLVNPISGNWELKDGGILATIRLPLDKLNLIVKIYTDGFTGKLRQPVVGAEVQLYDVTGFGVVSDKNVVKNGEAKKTNSEGQVVFSNLPLSKVVQYVNGPDADDSKDGIKVATIEDVYFPHAIKQVSAPEGIKPYSKYIAMEGLYAEGLNQSKVMDKGSNFVITKSVLNGKDLVVEIHNVTDSLGRGRIAGQDRYGTAVAIAEKAYPDGLSQYNENNGRRTVILANGYTFSDALVAGPLARVMSAPILLTAKDSIPEVTMNYLKDDGNDNMVEQVVIMGGNNSISEKVIAQLNKEGIEYISRIDGANRFDTAVKAAEKINMLARGTNEGGAGFDRGFTTSEKTGSYMFVANGYTFADALTASTPAARNGIPILLTAANNLPAETKNAIENHKVQNVVVVGGEKSVSPAVYSELTSTKANVARIAGDDRSLTAIEVAKNWMTDATAAYFASSSDMKAADALSASTLGALNNMPILLVGKDKVSDELKDYINDSKLTQGTIIGGTDSISIAVRDQLDKIFTEK